MYKTLFFLFLLNKTEEYFSKLILGCWKLLKQRGFEKAKKRGGGVKYVEYEVYKIMRTFS